MHEASKFGLRPHLVDTFKLSSDPLFIGKVRDVVGLYLNPSERAVVLSLDEKSGIQALNRFAPLLPLMPGVAERRSFDYARGGTTDLDVGHRAGHPLHPVAATGDPVQRSSSTRSTRPNSTCI
jgi:hypothetical protein